MQSAHPLGRRRPHLGLLLDATLAAACSTWPAAAGRHVRWLAAQGFARHRRRPRRGSASRRCAAVAEIIVADIEGAPWPLPGRRFDAVVVTNYLWRAAVAGAARRAGRRRRADLRDLRRRPADRRQAVAARLPAAARANCCRACAGLRVVAYEDGFEPPRRRASCSASPPCAEAPAAAAAAALRASAGPRAGG